MRRLAMHRLLLLAAMLTTVPVAWAVEDVLPGVIESPPPQYPAEEFYLGITGTVMLIMDVGLDGAVEQVFVEQSSRNRALDKAAIDAARTWRFSSAVVNGVPARGRVRIPVSFAWEPGDAEDEAMRERALTLPSRLQMPASSVELDADGTVPGYIEDPVPLEVGNVADAIAMLKARGSQRSTAGMPPGVAIYTLDGENDRTRWLVYEGAHYYVPALVRKRVAHDGHHAYLVTRVLCEAMEADVCARLDRGVQRPYRQRAVPLEPGPGR